MDNNRSGALNVFRSTNFSLLWMASFLSTMSFFMVMLARGWLILEMTDSPFMVTAVQGISMIPMAILPPIGGVVADRIDRRLILIASDVVNFLILFVLTLLLFTSTIEIWHVFGLALLNGVSFSFVMPARAAMVPDVLGSAQSSSGIALFTTIFSTSQLIGPFIAGYLLNVDPIRMGWPFLAANLMLIPSVGLLLFIHPPAPGFRQVPNERLSMFKSIAEGFVYTVSNQLLVGLLVLGLIFSVFGFPYQTLLPVFARDVLDVGPQGLGLLAGFGGVGAILGSFAVAVFSKGRQLQALTVIGGLGFGITVMVFAYSSSYGFSLFLSLALGFLMQIFMTANFTLVNVAAPAYIRGRVMGLRYLIMGMGPIGVFGVGYAAEIFGSPIALGVSGVLSLVLIAGTLSTVPSLRRIEAELSQTNSAEETRVESMGARR